jgi:Zn-dependent protease
MFSDLPLTEIAYVLVAMLISVPLHEAMHGFAARALGDTTAEEAGRLTVNPIKHVDLMMTIILPAILLLLHLPPIFVAKPVPFNPDRVRFGEYGAALVGLAGPVTNLILAVVAALLLRFAGLPTLGGFGEFISIFIAINLALFVFNLIPIPPLDGSRLVYAVAPEPLQRVMYALENAGLAITLVILLLLSPFIFPLVDNITTSLYTFLLR